MYFIYLYLNNTNTWQYIDLQIIHVRRYFISEYRRGWRELKGSGRREEGDFSSLFRPVWFDLISFFKCICCWFLLWFFPRSWCLLLFLLTFLAQSWNLFLSTFTGSLRTLTLLFIIPLHEARKTSTSDGWEASGLVFNACQVTSSIEIFWTAPVSLSCM